MAGGKDKKKGKGKGGGMSHIASSLIPVTAFAAVPRSPPPPKEPPKPPSALATALLNASFTGSKVGLPYADASPDGTLRSTFRLDQSGHSFRSMDRGSLEDEMSDVDSEMYSDELEMEDGYATVPPDRDNRLGTLSDRDRMPTPPSTPPERDTGPAAVAPLYHQLDREAELREQGDPLYSKPRKGGKGRTDIPVQPQAGVDEFLSDDSELTAVSSPASSMASKTRKGKGSKKGSKGSKKVDPQMAQMVVADLHTAPKQGRQRSRKVSSPELPAKDMGRGTFFTQPDEEVSGGSLQNRTSSEELLSNYTEKLERKLANSDDQNQLEQAPPPGRRSAQAQRPGSSTQELRRQNEQLLRQQQEIQDRLENQQREQRKFFDRLQTNGSQRQDISQMENAELRETLTQLEDQLHAAEQHNQKLQVEKQAVMEVNDKLHAENHSLRNLSKSLQEQAPEAGQLALIKQQAEEVVHENDALKRTVHRLNVELSRYQAKYRPPSPQREEGKDARGLPTRGPIPPWLVDTKYLSPLLLAYDDRLQERDAALHRYEEELNDFKTRVEEILAENQALHKQLHDSDASVPVNMDEWYRLQEQARSVLEENQVLLQQLEVQQEKGADTHRRHIQEVSKLSKRLMQVESEKGEAESQLSQLKGKFNQLRRRYEHLEEESQQQMPIQRHAEEVAEFKNTLQDMRHKQEGDMENVLSRLQSVQTEKKSLAIQNTDLQANNKQLEGEIQALGKALRKAQQKLVLMQRQVEFAVAKEADAQHYLSSVLKVAEQTVHERDSLAKIAQAQQEQAQRAVDQVLQEKFTMGRLEERMKQYKSKTTDKLGSVLDRLREQTDDFNSQRQEYQREIRHLQQLLQDKQDQVDSIIADKKRLDRQLETVWQTATADNRRMRETLKPSSRKKNRDFEAAFGSDSDHHLLSSESDR
ncbi:PREDICTED: centrosomal protein of 89 kDa-like isoform X1 [Branchiostoma belcheri]|uniref:Centrosomal protein of 89 kDa-like isoform X1 n=1 Tax=Branchiostoma belcheri TaxID=7741 RepID=A0A6P4ZG45_BRABE|nr:PREDICTED: centrosomal protein of 89 kDa-like isoform X1 [Branchiostoma belcheri]